MRQLRLTSTRAHSKHGSLAQMAELVDALLSGSSAARREGSSPFLGTISSIYGPLTALQLLMSSCVRTGDIERDIYVAACGMGVGADLLVRFPHQLGEFGLSDARFFNTHFDLEAKATAFARAD